MIPELDAATGHLLPGRYLASIEEVEARFVVHRDFASSASRGAIWQGFERYLAVWIALERDFGVQLLRSVWLAGSFISSKLDPSDIDVTPVVDRLAIDGLSGRPGSRRLRDLIGHRRRVAETFRVEPFPLRWCRIASTLYPDRLDAGERDYLVARGALDDWWQRIKPSGGDGPPTAADADARRGYLEVIL